MSSHSREAARFKRAALLAKNQRLKPRPRVATGGGVLRFTPFEAILQAARRGKRLAFNAAFLHSHLIPRGAGCPAEIA